MSDVKSQHCAWVGCVCSISCWPTHIRLDTALVLVTAAGPGKCLAAAKEAAAARVAAVEHLQHVIL